jgi:hypothetical protein
MYDENAPKLAGMGYFPVPVVPANVTYLRKKSPAVFDRIQNRYFNLADWPTLEAPIAAPQPGANIGVRCGAGLVGIDCDTEEAARKFAESFPASPVIKKGQRGFTAFFRADFDVPSTQFFHADHRLAVEVLSFGKQSVVPPSIHPDTKRPYEWTNGRSLYDTPPSDLPPLPSDYRERLLAMGLVSEKVKPERFDPETGEVQNGFGDNPCAELNAAALSNLPAWVPELLPDAKRRKGRYPAYDAVNPSRPSTTGRPYEQRKRNLGIVSTGIKDFGIGKSYSPLDLVMAVRGTSLAEAFCWLEEKLLPQKPDVDVDWEKIGETRDAPKTVPEGDGGGSDDGGAPDDSYPEMEADNEALGTFWFVGDTLPEPKPMLVPYFFPAEPCLGYVGAQTGSVKTFTVGDAAVAFASCGKFGGQQVTRPGLVAIFEMEGSSRIRLEAARQYRGIEGALPIAHSQKMPPFILRDKKISKEWFDWCRRLVRRLKWECRRWGLPLSAIVFDPLAMFSGITDIGNFAENTLVSKALIALANEAGCLVVVVDHYGKDTTRGLIGSIARESLAYFVLSPGEKLEGNFSKLRQLIVRKMRDGMQNICVDYRVHLWDTQTKAVVPSGDFDIPVADQMKRTLVIEWGEQVRQYTGEEAVGEERLTSNQRIVLNKINELLNTEGAEMPAECQAPAGLRGINQSRVIASLKRQGMSAKGFAKIKGDLITQGLVQVAEGWLWIPLPEVAEDE